ncbi:MAG: hypothetical protein ABIW30_06480 [Arenimonas sp.]
MNFFEHKQESSPSVSQHIPTPVADTGVSVRFEGLRRMINDPDWSLPAEVAQRARHWLDQNHRFGGAARLDLPLLSQRDSLELAEMSWSEFAGEVQDYLDFCRFRSEGSFRGTADERRLAWESACLAEAGALIHRQEVRERGYSRPSRLSERFRVC